MIKIESYTTEFEEIYWKTVQGKVSSNTQDYILNSSLKFMPGDFWNGATPTFKELILAPFSYNGKGMLSSNGRAELLLSGASGCL